MKRWLKWIVILLVLALLGAGVLRAINARRAQQAASVSAPVAAQVELAGTDVQEARMQTLSQGLAISGSLRAVHSAVVKARVAGELQQLTVREGDSVRAGQSLAHIDPTESQARLRQAQQQAEAAQAQVAIAQRQLDNSRALVNQGFISKTALDTTLATLQGAQATQQAAMATVDVARKALEDTQLKAPISGQVSARLAQPGERVAVDARVLELVDASQLELEATLPAADSVAVRVGQLAELTVEGLPGAVAAKVVRINPSALAGSRSVVVYLSVPATTGLRQGLFAQGSLGTAQVQALAVPLDAVRTDKPAPYVQVVDQNKIRHVGVQTGARGNVAGVPMVAVQGLAEKAAVIRGSTGLLREGTAVKFTGSGAK